MQNSITQGKVPNPNIVQPVAPQQVNSQPMYATQPSAQPNYAGVNIQIFNPMVGTPSGSIYPVQTASAYAPGSQGGCYPSGYYTGTYNTGGLVPNNPYGYVQPVGYYDQNGVFHPNGQASPNGQGGQPAGYYDQNGVFHPNGQASPNGQGGQPAGYYDQNGVFHPNGQASQNGQGGQPEGYYDQNGGFHPDNGNKQTGQNPGVLNPENQNGKEAQTTSGQGTGTGAEAHKNGENSPVDKDGLTSVDGQKGYYDKDGVFHPVDEKAGQSETGSKQDGTDGKDGVDGKSESVGGTENKDGKKTEKRKIVELSDDYIKTLENYLNSQDTEVRLMGAKEVVNRLTEDESRNDDPALTALVNKMLQDPSSSIRAIALSLVESRTVLGNDYTVNVLKKMQTSKDGFGQDAVQATSALLKMAGKTVEKEFEVKDTDKKNNK